MARADVTVRVCHKAGVVPGTLVLLLQAVPDSTRASAPAPRLEPALHRKFADRRMNLVNTRKEYFTVALDEIEAFAREQNATVEFTKLAEAREYRQTIAMRDEAAKAKVKQNGVDAASAVAGMPRFPISSSSMPASSERRQNVRSPGRSSGSLSSAAGEVHRSQSAVSMQLKKLEPGGPDRSGESSETSGHARDAIPAKCSPQSYSVHGGRRVATGDLNSPGAMITGT